MINDDGYLVSEKACENQSTLLQQNLTQGLVFKKPNRGHFARSHIIFSQETTPISTSLLSSSYLQMKIKGLSLFPIQAE